MRKSVVVQMIGFCFLIYLKCFYHCFGLYQPLELDLTLLSRIQAITWIFNFSKAYKVCCHYFYLNLKMMGLILLKILWQLSYYFSLKYEWTNCVILKVSSFLVIAKATHHYIHSTFLHSFTSLLRLKKYFISLYSLHLKHFLRVLFHWKPLDDTSFAWSSMIWIYSWPCVRFLNVQELLLSTTTFFLVPRYILIWSCPPLQSIILSFSLDLDD